MTNVHFCVKLLECPFKIILAALGESAQLVIMRPILQPSEVSTGVDPLKSRCLINFDTLAWSLFSYFQLLSSSFLDKQDTTMFILKQHYQDGPIGFRFIPCNHLCLTPALHLLASNPSFTFNFSHFLRAVYILKSRNDPKRENCAFRTSILKM